MCGHEVNLLPVANAAHLFRDVVKNPFLLTVLNPLREVMKPARVSIEFPAAIADRLKLVCVFIKREVIALDAARKSQNVFQERHAIEAVQINDEHLGVRSVQRVRFVWHSKEFLPDGNNDFPDRLFNERMLEGKRKDAVAKKLVAVLRNTG